ncbi:MAG: OsmC family protein [Gemmatimonadota bacterium]|nr:OsmC family protein [Gemmatimonadota bacterium]
MLGTLLGVLEAREVKLEPGAVRADVEGVNEIRDRLPVLTKIHVHYTLRIPADAREAVDKALARHQSKCPTASTLSGAVEVDWTADITDT